MALDEGGYPALDLAETVRAALRGAGATLVADAGGLTHCSPDHLVVEGEWRQGPAGQRGLGARGRRGSRPWALKLWRKGSLR